MRQSILKSKVFLLDNEALSLTDRVASCKRIRKIFVRAWNSETRRKCLLVESRIQLRKSRLLLKTEIQKPCSTEKDWNQESTTCNLESKTVLDSLSWGEIEALVSRTVVKLLVERSRFSTRLIYTDHRQLVSRAWITNGKMVLRLLWSKRDLSVTRALSYETSMQRPRRCGQRQCQKLQ